MESNIKEVAVHLAQTNHISCDRTNGINTMFMQTFLHPLTNNKKKSGLDKIKWNMHKIISQLEGKTENKGNKKGK